jgi:type I restriction enzyme S subunit
VKLGEVSLKITDGEHISPKKTSSGMPLLSAKDVTNNGVIISSPQYVTQEDGRRFRSRCNPERGDALICSRGTIGRTAAVEIDNIFCLMGSVILVKTSENISYKYIVYFLQTEMAQKWMRGASFATAVSALYLKDVTKCLVPVPSIGEQHRIVAKVDELMALCDRIQQRIVDAGALQRNLVDAMVVQAVA